MECRMAEQLPRYLDTKQAAELLELEADYLYRLRASGTGPPFRRHGRKIRYLRDDILQWDKNSVRVKLHEGEC